MVEEQLRKIIKSKLSHYSYAATQIQTHTHFFCYFTQGKKMIAKEH